jgi:hypothetical protein
MFEDRSGLALSTTSQAAACVEGVAPLLSVQPGEIDGFDRAAAVQRRWEMRYTAPAVWSET